MINPERDLSYVDSDGNPLLEKGLYYLRVKDKCIKIEVIDWFIILVSEMIVL